jgi:hypothetical protein
LNSAFAAQLCLAQIAAAQNAVLVVHLDRAKCVLHPRGYKLKFQQLRVVDSSN